MGERKMTTGFVKEQNLEKKMEKQMGCMGGFLQIFGRHQILAGNCYYSAKQLPPSSVVETISESQKSAPASPSISRESRKQRPQKSVAVPSPQRLKQTPAAELRSSPTVPELTPLPLAILELKEGTTKSPWKFCKEAPRLSLDSRATTDAKGGLHPKEIRTTAPTLSPAIRCDGIASDTSDAGQQRSPSVVVRLMGLEPLPNSFGSVPENKPELRRSASESRVSRDLFNSRLVSDGRNCHSKQLTQSHSAVSNNAMEDNESLDAHYADPRNGKKAELPKGGFNSSSTWKAPQHRKCFFDSGDIFPEPKQRVSIYGEIDKRLKTRGIDEPSKDLETLKQILEALQLKGLLHSKQTSQKNQVHHRNFVYDESQIVVMKPSKSSINRRTGNNYSPSNGRNQVRGIQRGEMSPSVSPRRERSPTNQDEANAAARRSNLLLKHKPLSIETRKRSSNSAENRRVSSPPSHSPKLNKRRAAPHPTDGNRPPRNQKATAKITAIVVAEDESSSISESSITTSTTDTEMWRADEYREGRNLLQRCDKLLNSIAEMAATDLQPSPVSVLDSSSFYKDDSLSPSPVTTKRSVIDFKDQSSELEGEIWSPGISPIRSKGIELSDDRDFMYISDILRACHYLPLDPDIFLLLEKQQCLKGSDTSKISKVQRKLIFDTIHEILDQDRRLPPWKAGSWTNGNMETPSLTKVWSEFQRIRERKDTGEDMFEIICGVLKRDLARDDVAGWGDRPIETSEAVLDIERLIFKDLISETIAELASTRTLASVMPPRRRLVF